MEYHELEQAGLTRREITVYTALLKIGECSAGNIIKESGIPGSKNYETLDKLKKKGLVSSIVKQGRFFFQSHDPKAIIEYLDEQRREIAENVIPLLQELQNKPKQSRDASVYEGWQSIKSLYELMLRELKKGKTLCVLGVPLLAQEKLEPFLLNFNTRRLKKGINMNIIYHEEAKKYGKVREKMKLTQVKYLNKASVPSWIDIFGNYVIIFDIEENPTAILIQDKNIARNFRNYFETVWASCS